MTDSSGNGRAARQANRLIDEKSPYLLQHAYNPVQWYAWGDEAFEAARREDKPVFLSIGYSTCHWCHVMEKESFENEAIAEILNDHFIAIKVDREERPDIDQLYMLATQLMTGGGGWPMSVFLFPDRKPFYAGTYFPPEPRHNHPGFPELLEAIARAWREKREELSGSAEKITTYLRDSSSAAGAGAALDPDWSDIGLAALRESYDNQFAGFGRNNKFPRPSSLNFLHRYHHRTGDKGAFAMARKTLEAMAMGGMYDHVGGGFHRYSVDRQWRIPHFEKMLYDQAQLVASYLEMHQLTGERLFAEVARETVEYVLRDLRHPQGGFYSAEDADSVNPYNEEEEGEGAFYLWQENEVRDLLSSPDREIFLACFNIRPEGNALEDPAGEFSGRNILYRDRSDQLLALEFDISPEEIRASLTRAKERLLRVRSERPRPHLDDKIITAWNGLMIGALARAGRVLNEPRYLEAATEAADFLAANLGTEDGRLLRRWREGEARFEAVLEDYAFVIQGLLDLHEASQQGRHLEWAQALSARQLELFADPEGGFFNSSERAELLTRMKETYDGAEPSGNSIAAANFLRLARLLDSEDWRRIGEKTIASFARVLQEHGQAMPQLLASLEYALAPPSQLVIAGAADAEDTAALLRSANRFYLPHLQLIIADGGENHRLLARSLPFLETVERQDEKAAAYLCRDFACRMPTTDPGRLAELLEEAGQQPGPPS